MKARKFLSLLIVLLLAGIGGAWAHGGRIGVGVHFGPYWGPGWYSPPPYYYRPQVVVVPAQPMVYIEQEPGVPAETANRPLEHYWYYCAASKAYYPYVKECPAGWQKVLPHPAQ